MKTKSQDANKKNIFIVDDNPLFSLALKTDIENTFKNKSLEVDVFETGETCMQKFKEKHPQVVILDYHLNSKYPDAADGLKVLDWIKKTDEETGVIMLTVEDEIDVAIQSFKHEAFDYVVKTESKFKKINYSINNIFKMIEIRNETKQYKNMLMALSISLAVLVGGITSLLLFAPSILNIR